jgi:hypothetical protein
MAGEQAAALNGGTPESSAARVALWRAMHVQVDQPPHVFEDEVGLRLAAPDDGWRARPDMHPTGTSGFRASIVARARFIEELARLAPGSTPALAGEAGFKDVRHVSGASLAELCFADRTDALRPLTGEDFVVATT